MVQACPVGQMRQQIMLGQKINALAGLQPVRHIAQNDDAVAVVLAGHGLGLDLYGDMQAAFVHGNGFIALFALAAQVLQGAQADFRGHVIKNGGAAQLVDGVAGQARQGVIAIHDDAVAVQHDGFGGDGGKLAHALFAVTNFLGHLMVVTHIGHQRHQPLEHAIFFMRAQHGFNMLNLADFILELARVAHGLGVVHSDRVEIRFYLRPDQLPHNLLHIKADNALRRVAKVFGIVGIGKATGAGVGVKIGQHGRCRICDQPQNGILISRWLSYELVRHAPPSFLGVFI